MKTYIPQCDLRSTYLADKERIDTAVNKVLDSGWYILGDEVKCFEREFAGYIGNRYAIGVASGTDALHLALKVLKIGRGDQVITVSHTAVATVAAIEISGAAPVLVDIDPKSFTMDPNQLEDTARLLNSKRLKAVIPVHIYGHPADMDAINYIAEKYGLYVIEDCSQAHGALYKGKRVGTIGNIAAFSFYPTKNLGAFGDGGAVTTDNSKIATEARRLREYGWQQRYISSTSGMNTRLDEIQAAILRIKLKKLDQANLRRRSIARRYNEMLYGTALHLPLEYRDVEHVYHQYVVKSDHRDELQKFLKQEGIGTGIHYPMPIHLQPAYLGKISLSPGELPISEKISGEIISLPMYPQLSDNQVGYVAEKIKDFYQNVKK